MSRSILLRYYRMHAKDAEGNALHICVSARGGGIHVTGTRFFLGEGVPIASLVLGPFFGYTLVTGPTSFLGVLLGLWSFLE